MSLDAVGIVTALASEAKALTPLPSHPLQLLPLGEGCGLCLSGMGPSRARDAAQALADAGACALAVVGVAGALTPNLCTGTLLCPAHLSDEQGRHYTPTPAWHAALSRHLTELTLPALTDGRLLSLPSPVLGSAAKLAMHERHQAVAVDMESATVAAVAEERHLPFVTLRAIIDECDDAIPAPLQGAIDAWGRPRWLALFAALGRHPSMLMGLPGLARRMHQATRALHAVAVITGPRLAFSITKTHQA